MARARPVLVCHRVVVPVHGVDRMDVVAFLSYIAFFCWSVFSLFVVFGIIAQAYQVKSGEEKAKNVEGVIVSIANNKVKTALFEAINHNHKIISLTLLVDEASELIPELKSVFPAINIVAVPSSYRRDLVGKGRALNYFVEHEVELQKWYAFIDDDNLILSDDFLYEIPCYEREGYVAMNPILKPRRGKSTLTYIMDYIRYFDDLTVFRFFTGFLKRPLSGFHGELLTVKGCVLKEIGFHHHSIVEDFRFAAGLVRRGYKCWQSRTVVSIRSPNNLNDLLRQRGRWFKGVMLDLKYVPTSMIAVVGTRMVIWIFGIFGSWLLFPLWFYWGSFYYALPGGIYYWVVYIYGCLKAQKPTFLFLIPLFGIFECFSLFHAPNQRGFIVIDKN